ncbi:MAG: 16S rRNA (cytosine(1402)-N(4))-methyltransferase RsmH [Patescibacteria group bacterium]|nr:16S rRNA (cytosine(1402)-N(4))-methyltransferase RsmH [Patescibacteria group bacterium]
MSDFHTSVLLKEALEFLNVQEGKKYIDATLGGGGHSLAIIERGGIVLGIDLDQEAIGYVKRNFKFQISNFKLTLARGNFKDIDEIAGKNGFQKVSGIIFDLGVSSFQLDHKERGFSFEGGEKLDMRMDTDLKITAADLINGLTKKELSELFMRLGEERRAPVIAQEIVKYRSVAPIQTISQLILILQDAYKIRARKISAFTKASIAKRVFQALRIAVNDEFNNLRQALPKALSLLENRGRIVVISFHSLEDGIVKRIFEEFGENHMGMIITKKPMVPGFAELKLNSRSRSAKMRVFERVI